MISGFLGTLIAIERAVAISHFNRKYRITYISPLLSGLGAIALVFPVDPIFSRILALLGAVGLFLIFMIIYRLQPSTEHIIMGLASLLWLIGNVLWLMGNPFFEVVPWWAGFLILTIAGERLELARISIVKQLPRRIFLLIVGILLFGFVMSLIAFKLGTFITGLSFVGLALWLLRFDIARYTIQQKGQTRYIAACLLLGYIWLLVGGILWMMFGGRYLAGPIYDAMLHTIFIGFTFSMIFGHALVIVPGVMGVQVRYSSVVYLPLGLLHAALVLRVIGDLKLNQILRQWGGMMNEVAIIMFISLLIFLVIKRK
ncbi:MAG: hypothetical protein DWQ07_19030 [Chloroflexi bacterium]|nr:MAG: hypothetical protein DWQ07_19030 [Chloroflexota bacterium]MBL1195027.1 hypothetical protein [Chloroflexota bacterium]